MRAAQQQYTVRLRTTNVRAKKTLAEDSRVRAVWGDKPGRVVKVKATVRKDPRVVLAEFVRKNPALAGVEVKMTIVRGG